MTLKFSEPPFFGTSLLVSLLPLLLLMSRAIADLTVFCAVFYFLYWSFKNKQWHWAQSGWFKLTLVLWGYLLTVNSLNSQMPLTSLTYAFTFIRWPLFAVSLAALYLTSSRHQQLFLFALILTSIFIVLDTFWQYWWGVDWFGIEKLNEDRLTGPFRNPVPGTLMLRVWFVLVSASVILPILKVKHRQFYFITLSLIMGCVFIFITGERMAFALYCLGAGAIIVGLWNENSSFRSTIVLTVSLGLLGFITLMQFVPSTSERTIWSVFEKLNHFADSDYGHVFRAAYEAWLQNPVFGSGLHTYKNICEQMGVLQQFGMTCTHPHNLYLQLAAETGLVGLTLFVLSLLALYHHVAKPLVQRKNWFKLALCMSVMTVSFWPLTGGISVMNNWVAALVWLGVGWSLAISNSTQLTQPQEKAQINR